MGIGTLSDTFNTFSIGRFNIYFSQREIARHDLHENFLNRIDKNPKKERNIPSCNDDCTENQDKGTYMRSCKWRVVDVAK